MEGRYDVEVFMRSYEEYAEDFLSMAYLMSIVVGFKLEVYLGTRTG